MRAGLDWSDLREALSKLHDLRTQFSMDVAAAVLKDSDAGLDAEELPNFIQARRTVGLGRSGMLERLLFATRLQALDVQYHELGGLYDLLHDAGRMHGVIATPEEIETASRVPPEGGRAEARGTWIRDHGANDWRGDWEFVWQPSSGLCVDLRDPFAGEQREVQLTLPEGEEAWHIDVLGLLRHSRVAPA